MARLRMGIVGLGFGRHMVEQALAEPACRWVELVAVADLNPSRLEAVAGKYRLQGYATLDELLARPDLDVVGLFSGPVGRAELIRRIIRAGKHVLTTKPFEHDAAAGLAVLREAQALGRVVHLNSPGPVPTGDLRQILDWHRAYDLGEPVAARWETWVRYAEQPDGSWYDDPHLCPVPPIYRLGIYGINDLIRLFGIPVAVHAFESRLFTKRPTADNGLLTVRFANGALASFFASFCSRAGAAYSNTLTLNYARGAIYRNAGPKLAPDAPTRLHLVTGGQDAPPVTAQVELRDASGLYHWEALARAIAGEALPDLVTPEQIVAGVSVIAAMAKSVATGAEVAV